MMVTTMMPACLHGPKTVTKTHTLVKTFRIVAQPLLAVLWQLVCHPEPTAGPQYTPLLRVLGWQPRSLRTAVRDLLFFR